jgi:N-acetylglucosamine-6-phosphate deacetylase
MPPTVFIADTVYAPERIDNAAVVIEDGLITAAGPREQVAVPANAREVRLDGGFLTPGFIDTHNHGAGGRDVMEATGDSLDVVCQVLARHGTTSYYPTTITAAAIDIRRQVEFLAEYIEQREHSNALGAQPLGIHMEGPYLSEKRRGVHPPEYLAEPTLEAYRQFAQAARGRLSIMTIAPELAHASEVIEEMVRTGVRPSMGHTDASFDIADRAVHLGVRQATHMFNAMRPFGHRDPGVIGKVLDDPAIAAELIADGIHVDPQTIRVLYRCKGRDGIVLISDGISATGMPDGNYRVGILNVEVKDGACRFEGHLAGSVLTLDQAIRNMHQLVGIPLEEAIQMATLNTARLMGLEGRKGAIRKGADADLVVWGGDLQIKQVYARGAAVLN